MAKRARSTNDPAALSYLRLIYDERTAASYADNLKKAMLSEFKAKDIFRASNLSLPGIGNIHFKSDQQKIQSRAQLSPLLLVRDSVNGRVNYALKRLVNHKMSNDVTAGYIISDVERLRKPMEQISASLLQYFKINEEAEVP